MNLKSLIDTTVRQQLADAHAEIARLKESGRVMVKVNIERWERLNKLQEAAQAVLDNAEYSVTRMTAGLHRSVLDDLQDALNKEPTS